MSDQPGIIAIKVWRKDGLMDEEHYAIADFARQIAEYVDDDETPFDVDVYVGNVRVSAEEKWTGWGRTD